MKYIDADRLREELQKPKNELKAGNYYLDNSEQAVGYENALVDFELLIDSLQQEQPNDVRAEIEKYYGEDLAFEDERAKAAYHFFSSGKAFELREYEEERKRHITDLLDAAQKGMKAGYEKAISELKDYTIGKDAFEFFFGLIGIFNHYAFFTKKLWKKVEGFKDKDEAEVKCAFMSLWALRHLGIRSYPVGAAWCCYNGDESCFDDYIREWKPVFNAFMDWMYKSR